MRWVTIWIFAAIIHTGSLEEAVEVVEAIPVEAAGNGQVGGGHEAVSGTDQLALESTAIDQDSAASGHVYNPTSNRGLAANRNSLNKPFSSYHGPPPPLEATDKLYTEQHNYGNDLYSERGGSAEQLDIAGLQVNELWPVPIADTPKIISLDVKCEKNSMKVYIGFDKPFFGIVFSKGHYSNANCVHLQPGLGRTNANFDISIHACGTSGNTENGYYGYGADSGSGTYFENIIVIQYDPQVQEIWDQARKLRCTWHDQYEKSVTFRPFPVDMLEIVRADFAGDNVGCWMQIQVGRGPWASEVSGLVKIGQTMTMVLAIKDYDSKFDMLVRNCMAHDGKRAPIQLVDQRGCVTRPKLMSRFTKIKNFGASASILSYAHFQAFKFPDSMEVHFQCTIQICRHQCPEQCHHHDGSATGSDLQEVIAPPQLPLESYIPLSSGGPRDDRRSRRTRDLDVKEPEQAIGVNKIIRVISTGDLTFSLEDGNDIDNKTSTANTMVFPLQDVGLICMTTPGFVAILFVLLIILVVSCLFSAFLCVRLRAVSYSEPKASPARTATTGNKKGPNSCFYS